jgi:hypothetical protein
MPPCAIPSASNAEKFVTDLARYRALANKLADQRKCGEGKSGQGKSGQGGAPPPQAQVGGTRVGRLVSGFNGVMPPLDEPASRTQTGRAIRSGCAILLAGLVLASTTSWFEIEGGDVRAAEDTSTLGVQAESPTAGSDLAQSEPKRSDAAAVAELPFPLEAALIASIEQAAAVADLRRRLQQAQALSDSYAARLTEEQAHSRILEETLAEHLLDSSPSDRFPVPAEAPPAGAGTFREEPLQLTPEALPPTAEQVQPTAEPLVQTALPPPATELPPPTPEPRQPIAPSLQPTAAVPQPAVSTPAHSVLSGAILDRLMLRAQQLREQGDIAAARIVLESGADSGHGPALFQLAETYDPHTLSVWRTFGTKGDSAKARELYLKAEEAGVAEATERLERLSH